MEKNRHKTSNVKTEKNRSDAEQRRLAQTLAASEERFRLFIDNLPGYAWIKNADGRYAYMNKRLIEVLPTQFREHWWGRTDEDFWPDNAAEYRTNDQRVLCEKKELQTIERWEHEGERRYLLVTRFPICDSRGTAIMVAGASIDITEHRLAEEALAASEERYRELFENARDAIYVHDLKGRYTSVNRAAEKLLGFSRDEIIGKHYSNFVAPSHLRYPRENFCKKLDDELETIYEVDLIAKDRRRVPVEVRSRLILENGVPVGVQGTARDITERRQAQEVMRTYSRRLIDAQEAERQRIARELHDEIGQVLTAVKINMQTAQTLCETSQADGHFNDSFRVIDEGLRLVQDLSLDLRPQHLDDFGLAVALRRYIDRFSQRTGIPAELFSEQPEDQRLPRDVETACFRIAQEALTNVARHAGAKQVWVQLNRSNSALHLGIKDDGRGFDASYMRNPLIANATLGIRGMEERAQGVGGRLEIQSRKGHGTEVRARFPLTGSGM